MDEELNNISFENIKKGYCVACRAEHSEIQNPYQIITNIKFNQKAKKARLAFNQLIIGYYFFIDAKNNSVKKIDYYYGKVNSEHAKWEKLLYYVSINPDALKRDKQYMFSERNAYFVLKILSISKYNSDYQKIKKGNYIKRDSYFLKFVTDGFREIMIDAGQKEEEIKRQLEKVSHLTLGDNIVNQIKEQSDSLKKGFSELVDTVITYDKTYITLMDRIVIYKYMCHELKMFFKIWQRKWSSICNLMGDLRKFAYGADFNPANHIFDVLCNEISQRFNSDPQIVTYNKELSSLYSIKNASIEDIEKAENIKKSITQCKLNIATEIYHKHNVDPKHIKYVFGWEIESSQDLYWTARKMIRNWK